mmetsp:Transcript_4782/g.14167  ORF Transcript_4782/g.14167 Transcript_4782/m.14167 type:complete len:382 (-) Transcript_4782:253-1398(-)
MMMGMFFLATRSLSLEGVVLRALVREAGECVSLEVFEEGREVLLVLGQAEVVAARLEGRVAVQILAAAGLLGVRGGGRGRRRGEQRGRGHGEWVAADAPPGVVARRVLRVLVPQDDVFVDVHVAARGDLVRVRRVAHRGHVHRVGRVVPGRPARRCVTKPSSTRVEDRLYLVQIGSRGDAGARRASRDGSARSFGSRWGLLRRASREDSCPTQCPPRILDRVLLAVLKRGHGLASTSGGAVGRARGPVLNIEPVRGRPAALQAHEAHGRVAAKRRRRGSRVPVDSERIFLEEAAMGHIRLVYLLHRRTSFKCVGIKGEHRAVRFREELRIQATGPVRTRVCASLGDDIIWDNRRIKGNKGNTPCESRNRGPATTCDIEASL